MIKFQWPFKLKKRQTVPGERSEWIPFSNNFPPTSATRLATVGRCLRLYSDFLIQTPLKASKPHYLEQVLKTPCQFLTKKNFVETLVFELLLNGNFMAKVDYDSKGRVTALLPYRTGQIYCYPVKGEYSDPVSLNKYGVYYRDFKGRVYTKDDIFHIKDVMFNTADQINGLSRVYLYELLFSAGYSVQSVQQSLSASGLRPSWILSQMPEESADNLESARQSISKFFSSGQSSKSGAILTLPSGFELKQLMLNNPEKALEFLATKSDLDIARIFSVPIELISRSDGENAKGTNTMKESHRFFIKSSIAPFLKSIADSFSELAMDGTEFNFEIDKFRASDLREQGTYLKSLVDAGVLTATEAKGML